MAERSVKEINRAVESDLRATVAEAEEEYRAHLDDLADKIVLRGTRVVLLAGPSSSGKTTTANMLADRLRRGGHPATVISLDDFYYSKDDPLYPRTPEGGLDYETPHALRLDLIRQTIRRILRGEAAPLPKFDFKIGRRWDNASVVDIPRGGCAIIEGLHALNPLMTEGIDTGAVARVFVSVSTNISDGEHRLLSGRKIRFIRRLTRDYLYRASGVERTLSLWQGVLAGENRYLYPFKDTAEFRFDTFHLYELGVMRPFAERVLAEDPTVRNPYLNVIREALTHFTMVPLAEVPETSLIREFVPGGIYESLY